MNAKLLLFMENNNIARDNPDDRHPKNKSQWSTYSTSLSTYVLYLY